MSLEALATIHSISVKRRTYTTDDQMGAVATEGTARSLDCRIQPMKVSEVLRFGQQGIQVSHKVFFTTDPELTNEDIIYFGTRVFTFQGCYNTLESDVLWVAMFLEDSKGQSRVGQSG